MMVQSYSGMLCSLNKQWESLVCTDMEQCSKSIVKIFFKDHDLKVWVLLVFLFFCLKRREYA